MSSAFAGENRMISAFAQVILLSRHCCSMLDADFSVLASWIMISFSTYELSFWSLGLASIVLRHAAYITKRIGDRGDPCGRPDWYGHGSSVSPS